MSDKDETFDLSKGEACRVTTKWGEPNKNQLDEDGKPLNGGANGQQEQKK